MANSEREHMLLIPGLLRCIDDNLLQFLDSASPYAEIFIVTEKSFRQEVALMVNKYNAKAWYVEDLEAKYPGYQAYLFPGTYAQWLKFYYALNKALEWEEVNGIKFKYIHRIRTDLTYPDNFQEFMVAPLESMSMDNIHMLNHLDFFFSGRRDALPYILNLPSFFKDFLNNNEKFNKIITYVSLDQLRESDIHSAQYKGAFPIGIAGSDQTLDEFKMLLTNKYFRRLTSGEIVDAVASFASSLADSKFMSNFVNLAWNKSPSICSIEAKRDFKYAAFAPEHILARFYNYSGVRTHQYKISRFGKLKPMRFATTPFTKEVLHNIFYGDISFLMNSEIDWTSEINAFIESGGNGRKLYMSFAGIVTNFHSSLDRFQCDVIEDILNNLLIKCDNIQNIYGDRAFKLLSHEKGIKLLDWQRYYKSSQSLLALQDFDKADAKVQEGLDAIPHQPNLLMLASDISRASGKLEKSLVYAKELIVNNPSNWKGYSKTAQVLVALKRFTEAQAEVQKGLAKLPNQKNILQIANDVYRASGNREKSLVYAESLILHHPNDFNGYCRSAQDLVVLKRFTEAQAKVHEGLAKLPNQFNLLQIANDIYRASGSREKSLEYAERLILHHPNNFNGYYRSSQDLLALKQFTEAQTRVQEGLAKLPNQKNLLQIGNDVSRALGNIEKSLGNPEI